MSIFCKDVPGFRCAPPWATLGRPCRSFWFVVVQALRCQRICVTDVLELLGAGASFEEILADYPSLERDDILAAIDYAAYQTDHVVLRTS